MAKSVSFLKDVLGISRILFLRRFAWLNYKVCFGKKTQLDLLSSFYIELLFVGTCEKTVPSNTQTNLC